MGLQVIYTELQKRRSVILWARIVSIGILVFTATFLLYGIPTALISNPWFIRMIEPTGIDYLFLLILPLMLATYAALYFYYRNNKGNVCAITGTFSGLFVVSCPPC